MAGPKPERINPYASPLTDETASPVPLPLAGPFGLARPIHGGGILTRKQVKDAVKLQFQPPKRELAGSAPRKPAGSWFWLLLLFASAMFLFSEGGGAVSVGGAPSFLGLVMMTLVVLFALVLISVWVIRLITARRLVRQYCGEDRRQEMTFTEDTVRVQARTSDVTQRWSGFSKCSCSDTLALLHESSGFGWVPVPQSFFLPQDWDTLVQLIRQKLPEGRPLPEASEEPAPELPPPMVEAGGADAGRRPILGQGTLGLAEVTEITRHLPRWRVMRATVALLFVGAVVAPTVAAAVLAGPLEPIHLLPGALAVALVAWFFFWLYFWAPSRQLRKQCEQGRGIFTTYRAIVLDEGLRIESARATGMFLWGHYRRFRDVGRFVLLDYCDGPVAQVLPKSFFGEDDWSALVALLREKFPER